MELTLINFYYHYFLKLCKNTETNRMVLYVNIEIQIIMFLETFRDKNLRGHGIYVLD